MGLDRAELVRLLPRAIDNRAWSLSEDRISFREKHGEVQIRISLESRRRLGALELPVTVLEFSFEGLEDEEIDEFMRRFDLSFHRGGG
jgi:hypothetical protein